MTMNDILRYLLTGTLLFAAAGCKKDSERPRSHGSTGDEIRHNAEETAEDVDEEVDEAADDVNEEVDEATEDRDDG